MDIRSFFRPVSQASRALLFSTLQRKWGLIPNTRSQGHVDVSDGDRSSVSMMLHSVRSVRYVATLSSGRRRVLLVLMRDATVAGSPCRCLLVDSKSVVWTRLMFDSSLFVPGTVFEGEIVAATGDSRQVTFLVDDLLVLRGDPLVGVVGLQQRHDMMVGIVERGHAACPLFDEVQIIIKYICLPHDVSPLLHMATLLPYASRFLTLRPIEGPGSPVFIIPLPVDPSRLRPPPQQPPPQQPPPQPPQEPPQPNTRTRKPRSRVLCIRQTDLPDVYEIQDGAAQWSLACLPTMASSRMMREAFLKAPPSTTVRMRCLFNVAFGKWEPCPKAANSFSQSGVAQASVENGGEPINTATP